MMFKKIYIVLIFLLFFTSRIFADANITDLNVTDLYTTIGTEDEVSKFIFGGLMLLMGLVIFYFGAFGKSVVDI